MRFIANAVKLLFLHSKGWYRKALGGESWIIFKAGYRVFWSVFFRDRSPEVFAVHCCYVVTIVWKLLDYITCSDFFGRFKTCTSDVTVLSESDSTALDGRVMIILHTEGLQWGFGWQFYSGDFLKTIDVGRKRRIVHRKARFFLFNFFKLEVDSSRAYLRCCHVEHRPRDACGVGVKSRGTQFGDHWNKTDI
jgi:hypothetical protein